MKPTFATLRSAHIALLLFSLLAVAGGPAPLSRAAQRTPAPRAATNCERAALNDVWTVDLTAAYSRADSTEQRESEVTQSAGLTMVFTRHYDGDGRVDWRASEVTGSGSVKGRDVSHRYNAPDEIHTVEGSGAPAKFSGYLRLTRATCTYELFAWAAIDVTSTYSGSQPTQHLDDPISFHVYNRPIPEESGRGISGSLMFNGPLPVYVVTAPSQGDSFVPAGAAEGVRSIAGSKGQETAGNATVSWDAKPNPNQPYIADVSMSHSEVPTMRPLDIGQNGTVDGNDVVIHAKIRNPRAVSVYTRLRFLDAETNEVLPGTPGCDTNAALPPDYTIDLFCTWDTEGWAWDVPQGGAPVAHPYHRVKIVLGTDADPLDTKEKPIIVRPKPVILAHDVNADRSSWDKYQSFLYAVNPEWKAYAVSGMQMGKSLFAQEESITLSENMRIMASYIRDVRVLENAWYVDIVAHGMGGLAARQYIQDEMRYLHMPDGKPVVEHLVMLGTPNQGTECADFQFALNVFTLRDNTMALHELSPFSMEYFNRRYTQQLGVKFSVLAGNSLPYMCGLALPPIGDGFVSVGSAHHTFGDVGTTFTHHINFPSDEADFRSWVLPRLAEGRAKPGLAAAEPARSLAAPASQQPRAPLQFTQITSRTLAAGASADIAVPVGRASALRVAVLAEAGLGATLRDPQGVAVQTAEANGPLAQQGLRVLLAEPPAPGGWTLHLENSGAEPTFVAVGVQQDGAPLAVSSASGARGDDGRAAISVSLPAGVALAAAPSVTAELLSLSDGARSPLTLADDGAHGDGAAGDGVYGATTGPLGDGPYRALVQVARGDERAMLTVPIAATQPPAASYSAFLPLVQR